MSEKSLFEKELAIVSQAEEYIRDKHLNEDHDFAQMLGHYKKLFRQMKHLVKVDDLHQKELTSEIERRKTAEKKLEDRNKQIRSLLDNAGQGFLSFGSNLIVDKEYSLECEKYFGTEIKGNSFADLLFKQQSKTNTKSFYLDCLKKFFSAATPGFKKEMYLGLLDSEFKINGFYINVEYRMIPGELEDEKKILVIITDMTSEKKLEERVHEERNVLKMLVKVISDHESFVTIRGEFRDLLMKLEKNFKWEANEILRKNYLTDLFLQLHNFKGTFSLYHMSHICRKLHDLEGCIKTLQSETSPVKYIQTFEEKFKFSEINQIIQKDLIIIEKVLGAEWVQDQSLILLNKESLFSLETKILEVKEVKDLEESVCLIQRWRFLSLKRVLQQYLDYAINISRTFNKDIETRLLNHDDLYLDPKLFHKFTQTLVHVFRNMVDHGIESVDERKAKGKNPKGRIKCGWFVQEKYVLLEIMDDGKGVNEDLLTKKLIELGIVGESDTLDSKSILGLIFLPEVSTADKVSDISGRGVGLSSLKQACDELGIFIQVKSDPDRGTSFLFHIPKISAMIHS